MGINRKIITNPYPFSVLDKVFGRDHTTGEFYIKGIFDSFGSEYRKREYLSSVAIVLNYCLEHEEMDFVTVNSMKNAINNFLQDLN
jgi:hypothetical protein